MLWVVIRSASLRRFCDYPQHMFLWRTNKSINSFGLKKASYQELCCAGVQADLSFHWKHMLEGIFSHVTAHIFCGDLSWWVACTAAVCTYGRKVIVTLSLKLYLPYLI